ncbi:MAG TPA: serine protease [Clostridia bacterium]|nr:serine protease [Clostridia bacterium]
MISVHNETTLRKLLAFFIIISLCVSTLSVFAENSSAKELTLKEIVKKEESVVLIDTYGKDGTPLAQGSGFAVGKGLFVTNYHVLEGASTYTITDSKEKQYEIEGIVKYDADLDLAIIKSKELLNIKPLGTGSKNTMNKGDRIAAIGNPQGMQNSISEGIVSGFRSFEYGAGKKAEVIQITADISQGSSGGPLFDMKGNVIGITTAMSEDGTQKFALAIDHVKPWIQELQAKAFANIRVLNMDKAVDEYWMVMDEELKAVVYKTFQAMEHEDVEAYLSTIHKLNPAYRTIRETYGELFSIYDFDYTVQEISLLEKNTLAAKLEVKYTVKRTSRSKTVLLSVTGNYSLALYNDGWRIYDASEYYQTAPGSDWPGEDYPAPPDTPYEPGAPVPEDVFEEIMKEAPLSFSVKESVIHPTKPVIYVCDQFHSKVVSYNYMTKAVIEKSFSLTPASITFAGGEVYVALLKHGYNPNLEDGMQEGAIAILNENTLAVKEQFDINTDPFDIVVGRDGYIYIPSGSGQFSRLKSYSRNTKKEVSSIEIYAQSYAELHPIIDKVFTIDTSLSPVDIRAYNFKNGVFTDQRGMDSPYHGDYPMGTGFAISPDGKYIFTRGGTIFSCALNPFEVMTYHDKLYKGFYDIAFDLGNDRFFTGINGGTIYEYEYSTLKGTNTYQVQGEIVDLYYRDNRLIAFTRVNDRYYAETVALDK